MTSNVSFKRRVRDRMARTGERYMTARAHLLARQVTADPPGLLPGWSRTGGVQPDLAAAANALAHAGEQGLLGAPLDEVDTLGLAGGIGFLYGVFVWDGYGPTLTLTTRNDSMPDATVDRLLPHVAVAADVRTTTSSRIAREHLDEQLATGRAALVSVDESALPGRSAGPAEGGLPRVVAVIGRDGDRYLLDDQDPAPVTIDAADLAAARSALRRGRHRLVALGTPRDGHDPRAAVVAALRAQCDGYDEPPARPFASNVGTAGLRKWASLLTAANARSWQRVFATSAHRAMAFDRLVACINEDLTAPGAGRGVLGDFLDRAAEVLDEERMAGLAQQSRRAHDDWLAIAEVAEHAEPEADPTTTFADLATLVATVADRERALVDELRIVVDGH